MMNKKHAYKQPVEQKETCECKEYEKENSAAPVTEVDYGYYSKVLNKPFDTITAMREAEKEYKEEQAAKLTKATEKKEEAKKVEEAYKAMNRARCTYRRNMQTLSTRYCEDLRNLQDCLKADKAEVANALTKAETDYQEALKAFTKKYGSFHMTLRDEDTGMETTISSETNTAERLASSLFNPTNLFDFMFNL